MTTQTTTTQPLTYAGTSEPVPCSCPSDCGCKPWTSVSNYCGCVQPH
jgi:hypothetical protein